MSRRRFVVVGAGGHAKVIIATIEAAGDEVFRVLDDDSNKRGERILGYPVDCPIAQDLIPEDSVVILAIGSNTARHAVAARLRVTYGAVVHPGAVVHRSVKIGPGSAIFAGAVIQPDTTVGAHVIINTSASVDHDCELADFVHVAPGVNLAGGVRVEEGALMGIGSCATPGVTIGAWSTVGAGAAAVKGVDPHVVAAGIPARLLRRTSS